jgi:hypothetical protein
MPRTCAVYLMAPLSSFPEFSQASLHGRTPVTAVMSPFTYPAQLLLALLCANLCRLLGLPSVLPSLRRPLLGCGLAAAGVVVVAMVLAL